MAREQTWVSGFVLHTRAFRESSVIAELFTATHGRVSVVFRGVKSASKKNNKSRLLQPFQPLSFLWYGDKELKTGKAFEAEGAGFFFSGAVLYSAMYLNEILLRVLYKDDPHPDLFLYYRETLQHLQSIASDDLLTLEVLLRRFEWQLLNALGYQLSLDYDSNYAAIVSDQYYRYDPDIGFTIAPRKLDPTYKQHCFIGAELLGIQHQAWHEAGVLKAAKRLMRLALAPHLGDKPLKSRMLFKHVKGDKE